MNDPVDPPAKVTMHPFYAAPGRDRCGVVLPSGAVCGLPEGEHAWVAHEWTGMEQQPPGAP